MVVKGGQEGGRCGEGGGVLCNDGRLLNTDERLRRSLPLLPYRCSSARWPEESEHPEALAALADGQLQHLVQLLVGVVRGEAQLVETGQEAKNRRLICGFELLFLQYAFKYLFHITFMFNSIIGKV